MEVLLEHIKPKKSMYLAQNFNIIIVDWMEPCAVILQNNIFTVEYSDYFYLYDSIFKHNDAGDNGAAMALNNTLIFVHVLLNYLQNLGLK